MSEFIIRFPTLLDLLDFIAATGNTGGTISDDRFSIEGFFSEAELELAIKGMHGKIKPFDKTGTQPG